MTSPADLEVVRSETDVGLDTIVVLAGDGSLVHHTLHGHATVLGQGTAGLVSAVATFTDVNIGNIRLQYFASMIREICYCNLLLIICKNIIVNVNILISIFKRPPGLEVWNALLSHSTAGWRMPSEFNLSIT